MMKLKWRNLSVLLLVLMAAGCGQGGPQWAEWKSPKGDFSVSLPGVPTESVETMPVGTLNLQLHKYDLTAQWPDKRLANFRVLAVDYPTGTISAQGANELLESTWQSAFERTRRKSNDTLIYKRATQHQGRAALEWQTRAQNSSGSVLTTTSRNIIDGDRMYMLSTLMDEKFVKQGEATRFLDSFKILK